MYILGIDPGLTGSIAVLEQRKGRYRLKEIIDLPTKAKKDSKKRELDLKALTDTLSLYRDQVDFAVLEFVHSMPGQGVSSTFTFGRTTGQIEGIIAASFIPFFTVSPAVWKSQLGVGADKRSSISMALKLFPDDWAKFNRAKDHNRAEAALLATYGALYLTPEFELLRDTFPAE